MPQSGLITRGYGTPDTVLTRGLTQSAVVTAATSIRRRIYGRGRHLEKILVRAALVAVNTVESKNKIQGSSGTTIDLNESRFKAPRVVAKWMNNVVKNASNRIVITVNQITGSSKN